MTDMTDEELIAFIRANKDRIKGFVEQEIPELMEIAKDIVTSSIKASQ